MNTTDKVYGCILQSPDNTYLLVEGRHSGKWSFPKGHPNINELPIECAKRELLEETGLNAPFMYSKEYNLATGTYFLYKTRTETGCTIQDTHEISNTRWVTPEEMRNMSVNVDVNTFLRKLIRMNKQWRRNIL
jgi:8-oxo-dGTP pyrophosphatase MutT (NUDIX family)